MIQRNVPMREGCEVIDAVCDEVLGDDGTMMGDSTHTLRKVSEKKSSLIKENVFLFMINKPTYPSLASRKQSDEDDFAQ